MAISRLCSVPDCDKSAFARGWCRNHYARWFRTGKTTGAGTLPGEPQRFLDETVLSFEGGDCLIWPYNRVAFGYGRVWRDGRLVYVHRLVCEHVNGPAPTPTHEVAHSCGNGHLGCVNPRHLRWATMTENAQDKVQHGRSSRGTANPTAKLTEAQVREIRALKGTKTQRELASQFGVSPQTISLLLKGGVWGWVD